jgi:excisionase family DNA binding protein
MPKPDPFHPGDELLTVGETAALLEKDRETIRRWCRSGRLVAKKVGGGFVIRKSAVAQLLEPLLVESA